MKKLVVVAGGALTAATLAVLGTGHAGAEPLNVIGKPYGQASALLKAQGYKAVFGGSYGNDLPQAQCLVEEQLPTAGGAIRLRLNCTAPKGAAPGVVPGANGITTVTATPRPYTPPPAPPGQPAPAPAG
ncbi:hypothetical protein LV457_12855 [Mycobacterium sp. MYCO198283]|uniref:hypothetical protein n=1 Tax=Mycobacterium sp. MYCO198283 TaxID=2883505 RepID=UPI001E64DD5C|nr:hypothetical protein [Mycobacterium sp. MYCO198283]MCG5433166.1 hypothetical protein [Mycobacterium sp. MYCO198283]